MRRLLGRVALLACALAGTPRAAHGHDLDAGWLSLTELAPGEFTVGWRASSRMLQSDLAAAAVFPAACRLRQDRLDCGAAGLVGAIAFPWLEGSMTRVMVAVEWKNGTRLLRVATPHAPAVRVYGGAASRWRTLRAIAGDYTQLGIQHILTGFDHLLFVVALVLLVASTRQLLLTITAFTVAHSLSLAATVLGLVRVPAPPVEATIALSIVLVCAECLRGPSSTRRAPWAVAFAFGLLHGLGFASALIELGVPEQHLPAALLFFNLGVELGQLAVVGAVVALRALGARLRIDRAWIRPAMITAMGSVAAYWSLDRIGALFVR